MKITGIVPARFLTIVSHLVLVIIIFWSRKPNIESCLPRTYTQEEYDEKDLHNCVLDFKESLWKPSIPKGDAHIIGRMIIGLSVALGLFAIELIGFFGGLTMFTSMQCLLSICAHCGASVALSYFIWREWPCERFWYIFGFCNAAPAFTELITMVIVPTAAHAGAFIALAFFLFEMWPCNYYWYIFGFCSALPGLTEILSIISALRRSY